MHMTKTLSQVGIIIFVYYIAYYTFVGLINPVPALGDSWDYHIPISNSILNGSFWYPPHTKTIGQYFPGSSEAINSILILLHVPLTLSNIVAVIVLFFVCFKLGLVFRLKYYSSLLFASTICTLNVFVRWYNAVSIDVWVGVFFLLGIIFLERPQKSLIYFLKLGFVLGMLLGSKYTGVAFVLILLVVYHRNFLNNFALKQIIVFLIPFSVFGIFWYARNYIFLRNPFYPLAMLGFKGINYYRDPIYNEILKRPLVMFNAVFGEYNIWLLFVFAFVVIFLYKRFSKKQIKIFGINRLFLLGVLNLILLLNFPTSYQPWVMVSSMRYSYPTFIPLILCIFILASYYKKEHILGLIAIGNMLMSLSTVYYPKLTLIYIPLSLTIIYLIEKYKTTSLIKMS